MPAPKPAKKRSYLVVVNGAGEYQEDYNVLIVEAYNTREAVDRVIDPKMGYGKNEDGIAFVAPVFSVDTYLVGETRHKAATLSTVGEALLTIPESVRKFMDIDNDFGE